MKKDRFNQLVKNPESISTSDVSELEELLKAYPYFHQPRFLLALYHYLEKDKQSSSSLQSIAIHTYDRGQLKARYEEIQDLIKEQEEKAKAESLAVAEEKEKQKTEEKAAEPATPQAKPKASQEEDDMVRDIKIKFPVENAMPDHLDDAFFKELEENLTILQQNKSKFKDQYSEEKEEAKKKTTAKAKTSSKAKSSPKSSTAKAKAKSSKAKSTSSKSKTTSKSASSKSKATKKTSASKKNSTKKKGNIEALDYLQEIEKKETKDVTDKRKKEQLDIITQFIEKEPELSRKNKADSKDQEKVEQADLSEKSTSLNDDLISENLAKILIKQGKKEKAIDIYKKLIWKFPQKKAYFATQIENLKAE